MVLQYTLCGIKLPNPRNFPYSGKFPYPGFLQGFRHDLILGLPYPGRFPYCGKFPYPVNASICNSEYLLERNNI